MNELPRVRLRLIKASVLASMLWGTNTVQANDGLIEEWLELFTRCRSSIENVQPLQTHGLIDLGLEIETLVMDAGMPIERHYEQPHQRWALPNSRFIIAESEWPRQYDKIRRSCDVELANDASPIDPQEEDALRTAFETERAQLVAAGQYEDRDLLFNSSTALGFGPSEANSVGCSVISSLFIEAREGYEPLFNSGNGEQSSTLCGSPTSFLGIEATVRAVENVDWASGRSEITKPIG